MEKKILQLVGDDSSNTIIDGGLGAPPNPDQYGPVIDLNDGQNSTTLIKNFTIQKGSGSEGSDGGILMGGGSGPGPILENLLFKQNNNASVTSFGPSFTLKNSRIMNGYWAAKGIELHYSQTPLIENVTIDGHEEEGVYIGESANPIFRNVTISNNFGGGLIIEGVYSDPNNVSFINGQIKSNSNGGISANHANVMLNGVEISENTGDGGLVLNNLSSAVITQSKIIGNSTTNDGKGGGITSFDGSTVLLLNSQITGNTQNGSGSAIYCSRNNHVNIVNSILWGDDTQEIYLDNADNGSDTLTVAYSDIQGGQNSVTTDELGIVNWGSGNIDVNPMFVDTASGDYHLLASSMLINAGHPDSTDSDGTRADMGAYPYLNTYSGPNWFVSNNGNDTTATGEGPSSFRSIQAAINFASDGDAVSVSSGNFFEILILEAERLRFLDQVVAPLMGALMEPW